MIWPKLQANFTLPKLATFFVIYRSRNNYTLPTFKNYLFFIYRLLSNYTLPTLKNYSKQDRKLALASRSFYTLAGRSSGLIVCQSLLIFRKLNTKILR